MTDIDDTQNAKEVEFYAAQVNAWLNTRFEHDKSLLTLSAGGIGLLVTVALAAGFKSVEALIIYCAALLSFLVCLCVVLWIFRRNAVYLEEISKGKVGDDPLLSTLDTVAITSFIFGVIFASVLGVSAAASSYFEKKEDKVSEKNSSGKTTPATESFNHMSDMAPQRIDESVAGISNMKPQPVQPQQSTPQPSQSPQPSGKN